MKHFIVFLVLLLCISFAHAQTCSSVGNGDYTSCFGLRASCHYDYSSGSCVPGAPQNCTQYTADFVGCALNVNCTFRTYLNGQTLNWCTDTGQLCSAITQSGPCTYRSDCSWTGSACVLKATVNTCQKNTNSAQCAAFGCVWDWYLGQCYDNLAEVSAAFPCGTWSQVPTPNGACNFHSCALSGSQCVTVGNGSVSPNQYSIVYSFTDLIVNPTLTPNTLTFGFNVISPLTLDRTNPTYEYITIGM
jgi:hypothetical protein